ncbi:TPA: hypothetical protein ACYLIB_000147 [Burkholderia cenocepacia]
MENNEIKDCNQKCRKKYENWSEEELIKRIKELDPYANENFIRNNVYDYKRGLLKELCALECGEIGKDWGS